MKMKSAVNVTRWLSVIALSALLAGGAGASRETPATSRFNRFARKSTPSV